MVEAADVSAHERRKARFHATSSLHPAKKSKMKSEKVEFFEKKCDAMGAEDFIDRCRKRILLPEAETLLLHVSESRGISEERRNEISGALKINLHEEKMERFSSVASVFREKILDVVFTLAIAMMVAGILLIFNVVNPMVNNVSWQ